MARLAWMDGSPGPVVDNGVELGDVEKDWRDVRAEDAEEGAVEDGAAVDRGGEVLSRQVEERG